MYTVWNWIGAEHIQPGGSLALMLGPDTYFIRAEACDGTWSRSEVDVPVSGHQTWTVPQSVYQCEQNTLHPGVRL